MASRARSKLTGGTARVRSGRAALPPKVVSSSLIDKSSSVAAFAEPDRFIVTDAVCNTCGSCVAGNSTFSFSASVRGLKVLLFKAELMVGLVSRLVSCTSPESSTPTVFRFNEVMDAVCASRSATISPSRSRAKSCTGTASPSAVVASLNWLIWYF